jgi:hypothetical protein
MSEITRGADAQFRVSLAIHVGQEIYSQTSPVRAYFGKTPKDVGIGNVSSGHAEA